MTREEAIKELEILKEDYWEDDGYGHETKQYDNTMLALDMAIKALEQEPRKGHWIDTDEWRETVDGFEQWGYFRKCSKCGYVFKFLEIDNYCPNCGAKMESEDKE